MLAGVSITWYTWLEQGRRINASPDVLSAIGRALKLDDAGLDHLLALAQPSSSGVEAPQEAPSALVRLIDSMEPAPAYVLGPRWEFLAWNSAQARLYPPIVELEGIERNLLWVLFADPSTRDLIVDWASWWTEPSASSAGQSSTSPASVLITARGPVYSGFGCRPPR